MSSSFFDKAKDVAQQAIDEARRGLDEGQTKLDELATKKATEKLIIALGAATYAQHRGRGNHRRSSRHWSPSTSTWRETGMWGFPTRR